MDGPNTEKLWEALQVLNEKEAVRGFGGMYLMLQVTHEYFVFICGFEQLYAYLLWYSSTAPQEI